MTDLHIKVVGWELFAVQLGLIFGTAYYFPRRLPAKIWVYLVFTLCVAIGWFGFMIVSLEFDSTVGSDVPGFGHLVVGFLCWLFGTGLYSRKFDAERSQAMEAS